MAVVTFGGAYAVLAYMAQQAVETYGWLKPGEMLDGLGMAETTPGPLIMVVQFVGFHGRLPRIRARLPPMLAGDAGGLLATWCTFVPCFLWIGLGAPFIERLRDNKPLSGALAGITAAVVGVILNLAIWFALHTIFAELRPLRFGPLHFDAPVLAQREHPGPDPDCRRDRGGVPLQGRYAFRARRLRARRRCCFTSGRARLRRRASLAAPGPLPLRGPTIPLETC